MRQEKIDSKMENNERMKTDPSNFSSLPLKNPFKGLFFGFTLIMPQNFSFFFVKTSYMKFMYDYMNFMYDYMNSMYDYMKSMYDYMKSMYDYMKLIYDYMNCK